MSHLNNEQHISQEDLLRYVEDGCSRLEMRAIDRHLATCPMCSDAVEGLMLLSEPSVAVANLNERIDKKVAEKIAERPIETPIKTPIKEPVFEVVKRPFWQRRWAAAAAILMLFSGSFWLYNNSQKTEKQAVVNLETIPTADSGEQNRTPQYNASETAKNGNLTVVSTPNSAVSSTNSAQLKENEKRILNNDFASNAPTQNEAKTTQNQAAQVTDIAVADKDAVAEKGTPAPTSAPVAYESPTDRTRDYSGASAQNSVPRPTTSVPLESKNKEAAKTETDDVKLQEVVVTGASKPAAKYDNTKAASSPVKKASSSLSTSSEQILSNADAYFKQKNYEAAATEYTKFVNAEPSSDSHERALFQLATCYAKLNKKSEAKVIFEKISATNGQFGRAAKKALKDL
jgi:TolA-binding protein